MDAIRVKVNPLLQFPFILRVLQLHILSSTQTQTQTNKQNKQTKPQIVVAIYSQLLLLLVVWLLLLLLRYRALTRLLRATSVSFVFMMSRVEPTTR